ncbi:MAG: hypothetical protein ACE5Z5_04165 [Candidatus Bathyarchaeia archaeon]
MFIRERTPPAIILYGAYLVFEGLSLRAASRALEPLIKRSHVALWKWVQGLAPLEGLFRARRITCFLVDETMVRIRGEEAWVRVAYEPRQRRFLALDVAWTRSSLSAELFLRRLVKRYGRHPLYPDWAPSCPEACRRLGLPHRPLTPRLKGLLERAVQRLKDRTEGFDDHLPCRRAGCGLGHVRNWLRAFLLHGSPEYLKLTALAKEMISLS